MLTSGTLVLKAGKKAPAARLDLRPALCNREGCEIVWSLMPDDIRTLSLGAPLPMRFEMVPAEARTHVQDLVPRRVTVQGSLATAGFADALHASMQ